MPFDPQKNLPKGTMFSAKDVQYGKDKDSNAMKQMMSNKNISRVLDRVEERGEFYRVLREQVGGAGKSVSRDAMRKTLGYFRSGKGKTIDKGEAQALAGEFSGALNRKNYIMPQEEKNISDKNQLVNKNNPAVNLPGANLSVRRASSPLSTNLKTRSRLF